MLAWSEGTDNGRQKTRNHGYDAIVGGELFTDYLITPKLVTLNSKTQINRRRTLPAFSRCGMPTASSLAWKTSLRKVRTLWYCSRLRSVALTWRLIVVIFRQHQRCSTSGLPLPGAGCGQFGCDSGYTDCKIQRSGRNGQEIDARAESPGDYSCSGYLHHRSPVMGC